MSQALPSDPILVFDIETVADIEAARRIYPQLASLNDADTLSALTAIRTQKRDMTLCAYHYSVLCVFLRCISRMASCRCSH